jgi:hypothetical protein
VVSTDGDDLAGGPRGWHTEPVALALDDENGNLDCFELLQAALGRLARPARRLERKSEAEDGPGSGRLDGPAGDARAERAATDDERQALEHALPQPLDDVDPGSVQLLRGSRGAPTRDAIGLLDERDVDAFGDRSIGGGEEIRRLDPAARPMPEDKCTAGPIDPVQMHSGGPRRRIDLRA